KSIIINSLNLIMGARPSKDMIRKGSEKAMVSALFGEFDEETGKKIEALGFDAGEILIQRDITDEGKSTSKINGRGVSVSVMRELSKNLLNIHGQHDTHNLLPPSNHILFLDSFAELEPQLAEYAVIYERVNSIKNKISEFAQDEQNKQRTIDLLKYQLGDIDGAKLVSGEEEQLEENKKYIQNSEKIIKSVNVIETSLAYSEKGISAVDQIKRAVTALKYISDFIPDTEKFTDKLEECASEITDIAELARGAVPGEFEDMSDPVGRLDKIESRLYQISKLKAKYGSSIDEILEYKEKITEDLDNIIFAGEKLESLKAELGEEQKKLAAAAGILTKKRKTTAKILEEKIMEELKFLEMSRVLFEINIENNTDSGGDIRYGPRGGETVEFLIATNPGEPAKALERIASGGELSRIMLALKSVFAEKYGVDALVFDEIDSGISGSTAEKVGVKLKSIAEDLQVICVTHSAQIASLADVHYLIEKHEIDGRSSTNIKELDTPERIKEIARIMGGVTITDAVIKTAEEMVNKNN
ncbi:MAG: DNA repair protein RecN, partial [Oscillospiraceae bacterium]|nr:DNA repair protein RecN [Oscillospiraceae bacterium]